MQLTTSCNNTPFSTNVFTEKWHCIMMIYSDKHCFLFLLSMLMHSTVNLKILRPTPSAGKTALSVLTLWLLQMSIHVLSRHSMTIFRNLLAELGLCTAGLADEGGLGTSWCASSAVTLATCTTLAGPVQIFMWLVCCLHRWPRSELSSFRRTLASWLLSLVPFIRWCL